MSGENNVINFNVFKMFSVHEKSVWGKKPKVFTLLAYKLRSSFSICVTFTRLWIDQVNRRNQLSIEIQSIPHIHEQVRSTHRPLCANYQVLAPVL